MQPLEMLNNVQKARLLHSLLRTEIPDFISFLYEHTERFIDHKEELATTWKDEMFGFEFWLGLAEDVQKRANKYGKELHRSSPVFADQLFDGYTAIYCVHVLIKYAETETVHIKFKQAIHFLFT